MVSKYKKEILDNGLRVITVPMNTASATALFLVGVGSRYEEKNQNGISHFLEHMAFKGTKKRSSALKIAESIEGIGGVFNAFTSKDHTGYFIKADKKHLSFMIDILSDMLLNSLFKEEEIEKEKNVIVEEINMYEDTPIRKIGTEFEKLVYGDTPLGRDIAGKKQVVRKLKREDFIKYVNKHYNPSNTVIIIAGGFNKLDCQGLALASWERKRKAPVFKNVFKKIIKTQVAPRIKVISKKTEQAHLCLGVPAISLTDSRKFAMSLLTVILGGGMSFRLFQEVREKRGLAYYIRSQTAKYQDVGNFVTQAGVDIKNLEETVKVILNEYYKIKAVSRKELQRAKEYVKGHLILSIEDSRNVASFYGSSELLEGKIRTPKEILKKIDKVTVDEIAFLANKIFKKNKLNLSVIGPFKDKNVDKRLKSLLSS